MAHGPNVMRVKYQEWSEELEEVLDNEIYQQATSGRTDYEDRIQVVIEGEYPLMVRDIVAKRYVDAGWSHVEHKTSSENGERPGLTSFYMFY